MNVDKQNEIWKRVSNASQELPTQTTLLPEKLADWIMAEQRDSESYRILATRLQGADAAGIRRISAEEENHARELNTLYYVLTQRTTRRKVPAITLPTELCQSLRERYFDELEGNRTYASAAKDFPEYQELFNRLKEDEKRHAETMLLLLSRNLKW